MALETNPADTGGRLIAASKVNGTNVYNPVGDKLGSIYDVMLNKQNGKAAYAIMSFGGFLGMGEKYHPLPWDKLRYDAVQDGYIVDIDRSQLEGAPAYDNYDYATWGDNGRWGERVDDYYGAPLDPRVPRSGGMPPL